MRTPRHALGGTGGYTVLEIMTVLVLALLVMSLAVPSMNGYVHRQKTRAALDRVASDLAYARAMAVRGGRPAEVEFQAGGVYLVRPDSASPTQVKRVSLGDEYPGISLSLPTATGRLTFDRRGVIRDVGTGRFVASLHGASDTLSITLTGRVHRAY